MNIQRLDNREFKLHLDTLAEKYADPNTGFFGPDSSVWRTNRDRISYLGGLRALLMQIAHPKVAQGVADHSNFETDPLGRFIRTMEVVQDILFGETKRAVRAAAQVYVRHRRVRGDVSDPLPKHTHPTYDATDPELLCWVYATLIDSLIYSHHTFLTPLSDDHWEGFYQEGKRFAYLFGVPEEGLPSTYSHFRSFVQDTIASDTLTVTPTAQKMAAAILRSPHPVFQPVNTFFAATTLPPKLREAYGIKVYPFSKPVFCGLVFSTRHIWPLLPRRLRFSHK